MSNSIISACRCSTGTGNLSASTSMACTTHIVQLLTNASESCWISRQNSINGLPIPHAGLQYIRTINPKQCNIHPRSSPTIEAAPRHDDLQGRRRRDPWHPWLRYDSSALIVLSVLHGLWAWAIGRVAKHSSCGFRKSRCLPVVSYARFRGKDDSRARV